MNNAEMVAGRFLKRQIGKRKLASIRGILSDGGTVYIHTCTRITKLTAKHSAMIKAGKSGSLYVQRGKSWDCIDFCKITFERG